MDPSQDMRPAPKHRKLRILFWTCIILLWILLAHAALLLLAAAQTWWLTTHNRYYLAEHQKLTYPFPPVPPDPSHNLIGLDRPSATWEQSVPKPPCMPDWAIHRQTETPEQKAARRRIFLDLSEEDRQWLALGNGETVLLFDYGQLSEVYSDAFKRYCIKTDNTGYMEIPLPVDAIRDQVRAVTDRSAPCLVRVNLDPGGRPQGETDCYVLPAPQSKDYVFIELEYHTHQLRQVDIPATSRWEVFCFSYKKNFRDPGLNGAIATNRYGYRAPDLPVPKPPGTFRILCLGGSTTYEGADNAHTYPALLQDELRAAFPGKNIEVMNCGVEGLNSRGNFLHVPAYLELQPDLILGYLGVNDTQNDVQIMCHAGMSPVYRFLAQWEFLRHNLDRPFWPADSVIRSHLQAVTLTNLEGLRRIFAGSGIRFALCSIACVHYDEASSEKQAYCDSTCGYTAALFAKLVSLLNPELKAYCERMNLLYVPVGENIVDPDWLIDPCHLSQNGIALKAHIVAEALKPYIGPAL